MLLYDHNISQRYVFNQSMICQTTSRPDNPAHMTSRALCNFRGDDSYDHFQ